MKLDFDPNISTEEPAQATQGLSESSRMAMPKPKLDFDPFAGASPVDRTAVSASPMIKHTPRPPKVAMPPKEGILDKAGHALESGAESVGTATKNLGRLIAVPKIEQLGQEAESYWRGRPSREKVAQDLAAGAEAVPGLDIPSRVLQGATMGYVNPIPTPENAGTVHKIAGQAAELLGMALPVGEIAKVAGGIVKGAGIAPAIYRGLITGGIYGAGRKKEENETRLGNTLKDALMFGMFEGGGGAIEHVASKLSPEISKTVEKVRALSEKKADEITSKDLLTPHEQAIHKAMQYGKTIVLGAASGATEPSKDARELLTNIGLGAATFGLSHAAGEALGGMRRAALPGTDQTKTGQPAAEAGATLNVNVPGQPEASEASAEVQKTAPERRSAEEIASAIGERLAGRTAVPGKGFGYKRKATAERAFADEVGQNIPSPEPPAPTESWQIAQAIDNNLGVSLIDGSVIGQGRRMIPGATMAVPVGKPQIPSAELPSGSPVLPGVDRRALPMGTAGIPVGEPYGAVVPRKPGIDLAHDAQNAMPARRISAAPKVQQEVLNAAPERPMRDVTRTATPTHPITARSEALIDQAKKQYKSSRFLESPIAEEKKTVPDTTERIIPTNAAPLPDEYKANAVQVRTIRKWLANGDPQAVEHIKDGLEKGKMTADEAKQILNDGQSLAVRQGKPVPTVIDDALKAIEEFEKKPAEVPHGTQERGHKLEGQSAKNEDIHVGDRVKTSDSPQAYSVIGPATEGGKAIKPTAAERENGEYYVRIKNEKTGDEQNILASDLSHVGAKKAAKAVEAKKSEQIPVRTIRSIVESGEKEITLNEIRKGISEVKTGQLTAGKARELLEKQGVKVVPKKSEIKTQEKAGETVDQENIAGVSGEVIKGQEPVKAESVKSGSEEKTRAGGVLQTSGEVTEPGRKTEPTKADTAQTNPAAKIIKPHYDDFDILEDVRLGLTDPPKGMETIPSGELPEGTVITTLGNGSNGNRPPKYAFTPDGRVYDDSGRMMTHGGSSPWVLRYVTKWFKESHVPTEVQGVRGAPEKAKAEEPARPAKLTDEQIKNIAVRQQDTPEEVVKDAVKAAPETTAKELKVQKKFLVEHIDEAIKDAPTMTDKTQGLITKLQRMDNELTKLRTSIALMRHGTPEVEKANAEHERIKSEYDKTQKAIPSVTIEVPNDGNFTVYNNKETLKKFKEIVAKKFPTTPEKETGVPHLPARNARGYRAPAKLKDAIALNLNGRPAYTDGHILLFGESKAVPTEPANKEALNKERIEKSGAKQILDENKKSSTLPVDKIKFFALEEDDGYGISDTPIEGENSSTTVLLSGDKSVAINTDYYQHIIDQYPDATFKIGDQVSKGDNISSVGVYDKGKQVGVVMPWRAPEAVRVAREHLDEPSAEGKAKSVATPVQEELATSPAAEPKGKKGAEEGTPITDFGEKIGGARKDTAERGYEVGTKSKTEEAGPVWKKRFKTAEKTDGSGRFTIIDTKEGRFSFSGEKQTFATEAEAEAAIPLYAVAKTHHIYENSDKTWSIYKRVGDRKRFKVVQQDFASREDAMKYMAVNAEKILNTKTTFGEEILPVPEIAIRKGVERRTGPATPEMFMESFAPRGIEFGNWNNQEERQQVMNHAYDGLLDLAEVLNVPPKALMLNGDLAIAFGARGQGLTGAKAHYEPDYGVINLTKMKGAGSLAHEWLHAADHYLGRLDTKASSEKITNKRGDMVYKTKGTADMLSQGISYKSQVRPEVQAAYKSLIETMYKKAEQFVEDTKQADKFVGTAREHLKGELDGIRQNLARDLAKEYTWRKVKKGLSPASTEQLAEFDRLANILTEGGDLETKFRHDNPNTPATSRAMASGRRTNDTLEGLSRIMKAVRNRNGFNKENDGVLDKVRVAMNVYSARLKMLSDAKSGAEKTKQVPTSFAMEAKKMDQARTGDYWSEPHEMAARAFAAYVEDKVAEKGGQSDFLVYHAHGGILVPMIDGFIARPYPEGKERVATNEAFDKFIGTLKTKETEKGVALYAAHDTDTALKAIDDQFGGKNIRPAAAMNYLQNLAKSANISADEASRMTAVIREQLDRGRQVMPKSELLDLLGKAENVQPTETLGKGAEAARKGPAQAAGAAGNDVGASRVQRPIHGETDEVRRKVADFNRTRLAANPDAIPVEPSQVPTLRKDRISEFLTKIFHHPVVWVTAHPDFSGAIHDGNIFLGDNLVHPQDIMRIFGHELFHSIRSQAGYSSELSAADRRFMSDLQAAIPSDRFDEFREVRNKQEAQAGRERMSDDKLWEEYGASVFGDSMFDKRFYDRLNEQSPSSFKRLVRWIFSKLKSIGIVGKDDVVSRYFEPDKAAQLISSAADYMKQYLSRDFADTVGRLKNEPDYAFAGEHAKGFDQAQGKFSDLADRKERFEISDEGAKLKIELRNGMANRDTTLSEVLDHPELYKAYPKLKNMLTSIAIGPQFKERSGSFLERRDRSSEGMFNLEPQINVEAPNLEEAKKALLHEVQHYVQGREGFARGGNVAEERAMMADVALPEKMVSGALQIVDTARRMKMPIDELEKFAPVSLRDMDADTWKLAKSRKDDVESLHKELDYARRAADPFSSYRRLAGEEEARRVSARADMTEAERMGTPYEKSDLAPGEERVVRKGGGVAESREQDKKLEDMISKAPRFMPSFDRAQVQNLDDLRFAAQHEIDLYEEGETSSITTKGQLAQAKRYVNVLAKEIAKGGLSESRESGNMEAMTPDSSRSPEQGDQAAPSQREQVKKKISDFLTKEYGDTKIGDAHNATWISPDGNLTGNLADHQESAIKAMQSIGKTLDEQDAVKAMKDNSFVRLTIDGDTVQIDVGAPLSDKQFETISKLAKSHTDFFYDLADGRNGNSYQDFIDAIHKGPRYAAKEEFDPNKPPKNEEEAKRSRLAEKLGSSQFIKEDIAPVAKNIYSGFSDIMQRITRVLSPRSGVGRDALDITMKMKGDKDKSEYIIERTTQHITDAFNKMPREKQVDFVDRIKTGKKQETPELQAVADFMRKTEDALYAEATKYKPNAAWMENHYRVLWKTIPGSESSKGGFAGVFRRPLPGTGGMFKQHTLNDMSEGLAKGGVPYSYNPMTMWKRGYEDLNKFVTAQRMLEEYKNRGLAKFVREFDTKGMEDAKNLGLAKVDDKLFRRYFKPEGLFKEGPNGEMVEAKLPIAKAGEWYVDEGAARLLNNYISRDAIRESPAGRGLMWIKNSSTAAELAFSAFHATFETLETVGSSIGLGFNKIYNRGILRGDKAAIASGLGDIAKSFSSPYYNARTGGRAIKYMSDAEFKNTPEGKSFIKDFPEAAHLLDDLFTGGGKLAMHQDYKINSLQAFKESLNGKNYVGAAFRALPALNETMMKPLFETYIPRLKVGMFLREYSSELARRSEDLTAGKTSRAEIARKTWDFVEDRLGEMNFDNMFWNRTFKSAAQLMFRSVTWKLGNLRATGGAFKGQAEEFLNAFKEKRAPELNSNMAWLLGMTASTVALSSVIQYMNTGKMPQTTKDFVYPQVDPNDQDVRISTPTYWKDLLNLQHSPIGYVKSSLSSEIGRVADIWQNKDFYGTEVRHEDDPLWKQALEVSNHLVPLPFSVQSYTRMEQEQESGGKKVAAFLGLSKAPQYISQTDAERLESDFMQRHRVEGSRTQVETDKSNLEKEIRKMYRSDKADEADTLLSDSISEGKLSQRDAVKLKREGKESPILSGFKRLSIDEKLKVYEKATDEERASLEAAMRKAIRNARNLPSEERYAVMQRWEQLQGG